MTSECGDGKQAANWVTQNVLRELNDRQQSIDQFAIPADVLGDLLRRIVAGELTVKSGREVFDELLKDSDEGHLPSRERIAQTIDAHGLGTPSDSGELEAIVAAVIAEQPDAAEDVRSGKQQALGPLIGQVMRRLKGANPQQVRQLLLDRLQG